MMTRLLPSITCIDHSITCTLPLPTLPAIVCWQQPHCRREDGYHVDGINCCLIGIVLGVTMKKYPPKPK